MCQSISVTIGFKLCFTSQQYNCDEKQNFVSIAIGMHLGNQRVGLVPHYDVVIVNRFKSSMDLIDPAKPLQS